MMVRWTQNTLINAAIKCTSQSGAGGGGGFGAELEVFWGPSARAVVIGKANANAPTKHKVVNTSFSFFIVLLLVRL